MEKISKDKKRNVTEFETEKNKVGVTNDRVELEDKPKRKS